MHKLSTTRSKIGSDLLPSGIYLDLLKALPPLASNKCCVGLVLQIIQSLNKPGLQVIKLQLLYDLWAVENRCYPYLQRCLEQVEFDEIFYFYSSGFYCKFRILIVLFVFRKPHLRVSALLKLILFCGWSLPNPKSMVEICSRSLRVF